MRTRLLPCWLVILAGTAARVHACAVCGGGDNEQLAQASNTVLWALLGLVGFIFVATGATVYFLWRKANTPVPPHIALIETLNPADAED